MGQPLRLSGLIDETNARMMVACVAINPPHGWTATAVQVTEEYVLCLRSIEAGRV